MLRTYASHNLLVFPTLQLFMKQDTNESFISMTHGNSPPKNTENTFKFTASSCCEKSISQKVQVIQDNVMTYRMCTVAMIQCLTQVTMMSPSVWNNNVMMSTHCTSNTWPNTSQKVSTTLPNSALYNLTFHITGNSCPPITVWYILISSFIEEYLSICYFIHRKYPLITSSRIMISV